jgi:hypothetical protein
MRARHGTALLPTIGSFTATRVRVGGQSTLSWSISGLSGGGACSISPAPASGTAPDGTIAPDGNDPYVGSALTVPITQPTQYTLTCSTPDDSDSKSVTVNLIPTYQEI